MAENKLNPPDSELNPQQKIAVTTTNGSILVLAGAGAGKTKTIAERIRHLVISGVAPSKILALTFTNKAAREMRERVEKIIGNDKILNKPISIDEHPFVSTFHSLGVHILREQATNLGIKKYFSIFDRDDSKKAIKSALETLGFDPKTHEPGKILAIISKEKGAGRNFEDFGTENRGYLAKVVMEVWPEYEKILKKEAALDFDDLLLKTRDLLRGNREIKNYYQNVWSHIHIDEYQDTNRVQYEISKFLAEKHQNICVVGDADQNIYSWRGADIKNILDFEKDYPGATVIVLEENYRSTKNILEAANSVIEKNKIRREKNLFTEKEEGEKIGLFMAFDEVGEASFIAAKAEELIRGGTPAGEIVVLFRANFQSRALEEAFMNLSLSYELVGTRFFERKEIKDLISYLRLALNQDSLSDFRRVANVPARGLGKTSVLKIAMGQESSLQPSAKKKLDNLRVLLKRIERAAKERKPSEAISFVIKETGLEDEWKNGGDEGFARLENAFELVNFATRYDKSLPETGILEFLSEVALQSDQDTMKDEGGAVRLMTVHASKGLEFDIVFIAGLENGLFPHRKIDDSESRPEEAEEERRLFYVALTRARKKVFLSYAETRNLFGSRQVGLPSEFLSDIPDKLLEEESSNEYDYRRKPLLEIEF